MNVLKFKYLIFLISLFLLSCFPLKTKHELHSQKVIRDGREMLYGKVSLEQLYFDYPSWKKGEEEYVPQKEFIKKLKKVKGKVTVKIFFGTWCPDSKREVPRFFKIIKQAGIGNHLKIELWAVDRKKNLPNNLAQKYGIEYVPTFVFERNNKEIGRIIESPSSPYLEEDIWNILHGNKK